MAGDIVNEAHRRQRVLVITGDPLGKKLAGPAIRSWNMALELSKLCEVTLLTLSGLSEVEAPFSVMHVAPGDEAKFAPLEAWADVIVFQGHAMLVFECLQNSTKILVVDIYDPMHLEQLEQARELPRADWSNHVREATQVLNDQLRRGDFFICASETQRLFWLGQLAGQFRLNPDTYSADPDLFGLIDIVPFGMSREEPRHSKQVLKGVHPGIGVEDKLLIWGGGLYNWFDPHTLIRAVAELDAKYGNIRLFFQGTKHPHPGVPEMEIVRTSRDLAASLGALDKSVFFNDSWIEYDDRQNYLLEADIGVSTHHAHIETTFSFRTRILDYLWARLPMVVSAGDYFADVIRQNSIGIVVEPGNVEELKFALEEMIFNDDLRSAAKINLSQVREKFYWDVVLKPLVKFIGQARYAGDHSHIPISGLSAQDKSHFLEKPHPIRGKFNAVRNAFREEGFSGVLRKTKNKLMR